MSVAGTWEPAANFAGMSATRGWVHTKCIYPIEYNFNNITVQVLF